jgi:hypothetical protein
MERIEKVDERRVAPKQDSASVVIEVRSVRIFLRTVFTANLESQVTRNGGCGARTKPESQPNQHM